MGFHEKMHAFLAAKYYDCLTAAFGEKGRAAFIHATQYYGLQRGRRMAQRAIRDGADLSYESYMRYNELLSTDEVRPADGDLASLSPDYELHITCCPWHDQFVEMGSTEAGSVYCAYLDEALCKGFNPDILFEAPQSLNTAPYCIHRVRNVNYPAFPDAPQQKEDARGFAYHCAHTFWTYGEVATAIFGAEGFAVQQRVLADFAACYGKDKADTLLTYRYTNFNVC